MVYWKFAVLGAPCIFLFSHITGAFVCAGYAFCAFTVSMP